MGNASCFKRAQAKESPIRRIYIGDVPELDEAGVPLGRSGLQIRASDQSFADETAASNVGEDEDGANVPVPVRRQSVAVGTFGKRSKSRLRPKPRNVFPHNLVISSRYTAWNFLPKNVYEQFRRIVNAYFLAVAIIQTFADSPVSPITSVAPLVFVIIVTMMKQGYEDWLRHRADDFVNNRLVKVIRSGLVESVKSKDVIVGDIVKLEGEEQVPTDLLLVGSSDEFLRCQINTANLDGETNLKMRYCPAGLPHIKDDTDVLTLNVVIECEEPCEDLYRFNGNLLILPQPDAALSAGSVHAELGHAEDVEPEVNIAATSVLSDHSSGHRNKTVSELNMSDFLQINVGMENLILRGTRVKNTDFIYGIVVYTGKDTRLAMNSNNSGGSKFSTVESSVNKYLVVFIFILLTLVITSTFLSIFVNWFPESGIPWYLRKRLGKEEGETASHYFNIFASFLILFNYIIPISLYVTMEMQKFIGSKFFVWDADMAAENGEPPLCNTSDLNEELGQIQYLFSDKTGTLTENVMQFRFCSADGIHYDFVEQRLLQRDLEDNSKLTPVSVRDQPKLLRFLKTIALCHTVQVTPKRRPSVESTFGFDLFANIKKKKVSSKVKNANSLFTIGGTHEKHTSTFRIGSNCEYQASSPDEKALVESCADLNVHYLGEREDVLTLEVCGEIETYRRHLVLEFDADRKCMSVVVEDSNGEFWVLSKGAESSLLPLCIAGPIVTTMKHVVHFAMAGMRTLVVTERKISKEQYNSFSNRLKAAKRIIKHREETMRELYREIESELTCLGATGVEDQLQEGVAETLLALGAAGIRVWMLTGDKLETGINVAVSCGLVTPATKQYIFTNMGSDEEVKRRFEEITKEMHPDDNTTFIIDGETLNTAFKFCPELLCEVAMKAFRVVCCRMAPLQKAQVVRMVKQTPERPITAAIGDGANDVAMIQEAHIGIGIIGKEGRQAARCADFALAKFGFMRKAILVHGHWYYVRLANLSNYFFYKNIVFVVPQVLYCFHSAFSTQPLFDGIFLMMYNIFYTACPILFYGLMEQDYTAEQLLKDPFLYRAISKNHLMTARRFIWWISFAAWHAFVCYFFAYFAWPSFYPVNDLSSYGTVVFCGVVAVTNMKIAIETKYINWLYVGSQIYSYVTFFVFTVLYSECDLTFMMVDPKEFRHVYLNIMTYPIFWFLMVLVTFTAIVPDLMWKVLERSLSYLARWYRSIPKMIKLSKLERTKKGLPKISLLFKNRTEATTVSSATLHSYLSKEEI